MIYDALAEIISMDHNYGAAKTHAEIDKLLVTAWHENGTWAIAVAANAADMHMKVVAMIDAEGTITRGDIVTGHADDIITDVLSDKFTG